MELDNFSSRLREERTRLGLSQEALAQAGGVKKLAQHKYEKGENSPSAAYLQAIAAAGVDPGYLLTGMRTAGKDRNLSGATPAPAEDEDTIHIAVLSATGSMGPGNELLTEDVIVGEAPFSRRWLSLNIPGVQPDALRLIHAYGDSMQGTLNSGDFAVVDTSCRTVEFPGVYLLHVNRLHFIKRVSFRMDGRLVVSSDNEAERTAEVLDGSHQLDVRGRVVYGWNGRRF